MVIDSDSGLLSEAIESETLTISMGEGREVVVDFSHSGGQNLTLRNQDGVDKEADYANTDQVIRFVVGIDTVASSCTVKKISGSSNGVDFGDAQDRVLANVPRGTVEMWEFENDGGWTHPHAPGRLSHPEPH
ncbi:hypothetical protein BHE90_004922 [Fusarium euwallaceae]|uniref:Uncharacterized protein n=1 Tax=Fusarium euwallaceae TaxID=1147111 RepID=A0A430LXX8_9HYPO|nr:hypothetical protein BHE90_004922 [Fusarium euwallaceae]